MSPYPRVTLQRDRLKLLKTYIVTLPRSIELVVRLQRGVILTKSAVEPFSVSGIGSVAMAW
jgi:hypothetical protein